MTTSVDTELDQVKQIGRYGIQDLDVGGIFDHALYLIRDNFKATCIILGFVALPLTYMNTFAVLYLQSFAESGAADMDVDPMQGVAAMVLASIGALVIAFAVVLPLTFGSLTYLYNSAYLGDAQSVRSCFRQTFKNYFRIVFLYFIYNVVMTIGSCLLVIPGLIVAVVFSIAMPTFVAEPGTPVLACFERSVRITWKSFFPVFLVMLATGMASMQAGFVNAASAAIPYIWLQAGVQAGVSVALYGLTAAVGVALYYSLRCRHEGFDVEMMAEVVDPEPMVAEPAL